VQPLGLPNFEYSVDASSVVDAAQKAIAVHEAHQTKLPDETVVTVMLEGVSSKL
jgi:ribosomal protein S2